MTDTAHASPSHAAIPATTQRVVIPKAGSYNQLTMCTVPMPKPAAGEVLIEVKATGVNFADTLVRQGLYSSAKEYVGWPITPGFEVSGLVASLGEGVDDLQVGDEVFAVTRFGGYAGHLTVRRKHVFAKPEQLSFEQMAGVPAVFMTAWFALHELAHPRPGYKVLVHSAAGGVGGSLVQMAKLGGCHVVGVVGGSHKVETVRKHGADAVIDKSTQDLWGEAKRLAPKGYDVVLDANGVATLAQSYEHLRPAGKLVVYGFHTMMAKKGGRPNWPKLAYDYVRTPRYNPLNLTNASKSVMAFNLSYLFDRDDFVSLAFDDIGRWLRNGDLEAPPVTTYKLSDVGRAHADIESGKTVGKLVLIP